MLVCLCICLGDFLTQITENDGNCSFWRLGGGLEFSCVTEVHFCATTEGFCVTGNGFCVRTLDFCAKILCFVPLYMDVSYHTTYFVRKTLHFCHFMCHTQTKLCHQQQQLCHSIPNLCHTNKNTIFSHKKMIIDNKTILITGLIICSILALILKNHDVALAIVSGLVGYLSKDPISQYLGDETEEVDEIGSDSQGA